MGWTSYRPTYFKPNGQVDRKAECDAYFMGDCNKGYYNVKKSAMVGSTYYAAVEKVYEKVDGKDVYIPENERTTWAAIFLTSVENGEFFYKDMDETSGPYNCDCPKGILKLLSPTDNEWALAWRENCLKKHEEKMGKLRAMEIAKLRLAKQHQQERLAAEKERVRTQIKAFKDAEVARNKAIIAKAKADND